MDSDTKNGHHKYADPCPNCGYCPHCGRSNLAPRFVPWPIQPYPWWQSPQYPWYGPPVLCGSLSTTTADTTIYGNAGGTA